MKETQQNRRSIEFKSYIEIQGTDQIFIYKSNIISVESFKPIADYLTNQKCDITIINFTQVLEAAIYLQINDVIDIISKFMINNLTIENFETFKEIAVKYDLESIVEMSFLEFLNKNVHLYVLPENKDHLKKLSVEIIENIIQYSIHSSESDLMHLVTVWLINSEFWYHDQCYDQINRLYLNIRFKTLTKEELEKWSDLFTTILNGDHFLSIQQLYRAAYYFHSDRQLQPFDLSVQSKFRNKVPSLIMVDNNISGLNSCNEWETIAASPVPFFINNSITRNEHLVTYNNYLFLIIEENLKKNSFCELWQFSTITLDWFSLSPLIEKRSNFCQECIDNLIYVFGGNNGDQNSPRLLSNIQKYNILLDEWETIDHCLLSYAFTNGASCATNYLIFFGGGLAEPAEIINPMNNDFEDFQSVGAVDSEMDYSNYDQEHVQEIYEEHIFYNEINSQGEYLENFDNSNSQKNLKFISSNQFWCFDPIKKTFTQKADMISARVNHQYVILNDDIFVFGGHCLENNSEDIARIDKYDIKTNKWTVYAEAPCDGLISEYFLEGKFYFRFINNNSKMLCFDMINMIWSVLKIKAKNKLPLRGLKTTLLFRNH